MSSKSKWSRTPFTSLEAAHRVAEALDLHPSLIKEASDFRSFTTREGRKLLLIAQRVDGTGPVLEKELPKGTPPSQDPDAPRFDEESRLKVGPWILREEFEDLQHVRRYYCQQFINPDNLEILKLHLYRIGDDEYEYGLDSAGRVWSRVISKPKS